MRPGDMVRTKKRGDHDYFRLRTADGDRTGEMGPNTIGIVVGVGFYSLETAESSTDEELRVGDCVEDVIVMLPDGQTGWAFASVLETVNIAEDRGKIGS